MTKAEILAAKLEERATAQTALDALAETLHTENRDATPDEASSLTEIRSTLDKLDPAITDLHTQIEAENRAATVRVALGDAAVVPETRTTGSAQVTDPEVYPKGGEQSYVRDMWKATMFGAPDALERLRRSSASTLEKRAKKQGRSISTTAGAGGEFAPPWWDEDSWIALPRPGRPTANLFQRDVLPAGISSVNLPKISGGTSIASQTQNSGLSNTDITTTSVTGAIVTLGGIQVLSIQLLEQSGVNIDDVLQSDLQAELDKQVDIFCLNSSTTNAKGLLQQSSTTGVTFTSGSPTQALFWSNLNKALSSVYTARYTNPTHWIMHPSRWQWLVDGLDSQNRPLVTPTYAGPMNVMGVAGDVAYQGMAGSLLGLPVIIDPNIPNNTGSGTNQDSVLLVVAPDLRLYESVPQFEIFRETKADQGSVLVRLYEFAAQITNRLPAGIGVITGTGLTTPSF